MAEGESHEAGRSGVVNRIGKVIGSGATLQFFGIATMLAMIAALLVLLLLGVERSRSAYFQHRDLRELDRVAQNVSSTLGSLSSIASLHFVPDQLHFAVGKTHECLIATTSVPGAGGQATTIDYEFPRQLADQAKATGGSGLAAPAVPTPRQDVVPSKGEAAALPPAAPDPCGPLPPESMPVSFGKHELQLTRRLVLRDVLRPIVLAQAGQDPFAEAWRALREQAARDLRPLDATISGGSDALISRSFDAAAAAGAIRVTVHADTSLLDLGTVLTQLDAVKIMGPRPTDGSKTPPLLLQAGTLPPSIRLKQNAVGSALVNAIAPSGGGKSVSETAAATPASGAPAGEASQTDSTLDDKGDFLVFARDYANLDALGCSTVSPCSIVGVVAKNRFGAAVRELEGLPIAIFLIAAVTLAAFVPLIHLALLKRLDPISRRMQYVTWFSLTLLAASASIAALTMWTLEGSRSTGRAYAAEKTRTIQAAFRGEIAATLRAAIILAHAEDVSRVPYPAPAAKDWPRLDPDGVLLDTASIFTRDGRASPARRRFAASVAPSFGTEIGDRAYFRRAIGEDFKSRRVACVERTGQNRTASGIFDLHYTIDRVFARPDGVAKTVVLVPTRQKCLYPQSPNGAPPPDEYLLLAGYLQTFLATSTPPAFRYAVVDPAVAADKPNILFHSRADAELSEAFQGDIEDADRPAFQSLLEQLGDNCGAGPLRLSTRYRGDPATLTLDRLDPTCGKGGVDWILIMIEHRKDAGFALWRAASFAYGTWVLAILLVLAVSVLVRLGWRKALDRRPGLWLWPEDVLTEFTAPRFNFEEVRRQALGKAAGLRDRHVLVVLATGFVGVLATGGAARTLFALAIVMAAFGGRAYFRGLTAAEAKSGQRLDCCFIFAAFVLLFFSAVTTLIEVNRPGSGLRWWWGPIVLYSAAMIAAAAALLEALRHARSAPAPGPLRPSPFAAWKWAWRPLARLPGLAWTKRLGGHFGWMLVLIAVGVLPATAGFLDSIDHSYALVQQRQQHRSAQFRKLKEDSIRSIDLARGNEPDRRIPAATAERIEQGLLPGEGPGTRVAGRSICAAAPTPPGRPLSDDSVSALAISYLGLESEAMDYSDHCPISPGATFAGFAHAPEEIPVALLGALLPLALLFTALRYFRKQYFLPAPRTPVVSGDRFSPPLTSPRKEFVGKVLRPAALGQDPKVPFDKDRGRLHLLLGASADLEGDGSLDDVKQYMRWVNLLDLAEGKPPPFINPATRVIIVTNLDLVLQHEPGRSRALLAALEGLVAATRQQDKRYLFILAEIEPLDRIALLRAQCSDEAAATLEQWRWARLLQDFTLCAVVPDLPGINEPDPSVAARELQMIDTPFARALLHQLESGPAPADHDAEDRMIDYVAEQMADYYHRLWTSSGDEERVLLYHIAWRRHLKLEDVPALRSLLVRGLIVRSPEYRLMNKSFARYVRRIERPDRIRARACLAENATDKIWPLIRVPLIALAGSMLILVQLLSPQQATGAIALLPALGAIIPTLLGSWLRPQAGAA